MEVKTDLDRLKALAEDRAAAILRVAAVTEELKQAIRAAVESSELSEQGAAKLTGLSRMTIRAWMGK